MNQYAIYQHNQYKMETIIFWRIFETFFHAGWTGLCAGHRLRSGTNHLTTTCCSLGRPAGGWSGSKRMTKWFKICIFFFILLGIYQFVLCWFKSQKHFRTVSTVCGRDQSQYSNNGCVCVRVRDRKAEVTRSLLALVARRIVPLGAIPPSQQNSTETLSY